MVSAVIVLAVVTTAGAADTDSFKTFFTQGEALYQQGEYGAAIWNFRQADKLRLTPEVAYDLAKCHEKIGDQAYAVYYYRLYLRRSPNASDSLEVAERIGSVLANAEAEGRGLLEVEAAGASKANIANRFYPEFPIAAFLPPGDYELVAQWPAGMRKRAVSIKTGKTTSVVFEPVAPPLLSAGEGPEDWARVDEVEARGPVNVRHGVHLASYGVIGVGALALIGGTAFGVMSASDAAASQNKKQSLALARAYAQSANSKAFTANLLWAGGGAAAIAGGLMFVFTLPEPGLPHASSSSSEGGGAP